MGKRIVSFSAGKDSTAMLLRLLELGEPVDEIVFADTGFEFPELYEYIGKIEQVTGRKVTFLYPESTFEDWFYGKVTRGAHEGKTRGFPLVVHSCWWKREAKVKPLEKIGRNAEIVYVGIAYDEKERMTNQEDSNIRYPLVEWKWTEADCVDYLNRRGLLNPLYVNFNRLGCWLCPKQGEGSLYVVWKNYPHLWEKFLWWDQETFKHTGHWIKDDVPLSEIQKDFEAGKVFHKLPKYDCFQGCEGVKKAYTQSQKGLKIFVDEVCE